MTYGALLLQQYWHAGQLVEPANVIHIQFSGIWHRLFFDHGVVFWGVSDRSPEAWRDTEHEWDNPLHDLGVESGVVGARLDQYTMNPISRGSVVEFVFKSGPRIVFRDLDDHTSYEVI